MPGGHHPPIDLLRKPNSSSPTTRRINLVPTMTSSQHLGYHAGPFALRIFVVDPHRLQSTRTDDVGSSQPWLHSWRSPTVPGAEFLTRARRVDRTPRREWQWQDKLAAHSLRI